MRNFIITLAIIVIVLACKKQGNVPNKYIGSWEAKTAQFLSTEDRIHTLTINSQTKGIYTSNGRDKISDINTSGWVNVENGILSVGKKEFDIFKEPYLGSDSIMEMQLDNLDFKKL